MPPRVSPRAAPRRIGPLPHELACPPAGMRKAQEPIMIGKIAFTFMPSRPNRIRLGA